MPLATRIVEPTGFRTSAAFVDRVVGDATVGTFENLHLPVYPPPSWSLREYRRQAGLTLREAAERLGVRVSVVSLLELGARVPVGGWSEVRRLLDEAP